MAHAKAEDLKDLGPLLESIRALGVFNEKSLGCFYYKNKSILHFHIKQGRRYAHVSDGKQWHEIDLPSPTSSLSQKKAFAKIRSIVSFV